MRDSLQRLGVVHALTRGAVGRCPGDALPGSWDLWAKPGAVGVPLHGCARPNARPKIGPKSNRSQNRVRSEPPEWFQEIDVDTQFKPAKKQKTQSVFT